MIVLKCRIILDIDNYNKSWPREEFYNLRHIMNTKSNMNGYF